MSRVAPNAVDFEEIINLLHRKLDWYLVNKNQIKKVEVTDTKDFLAFKIELGKYGNLD